MPSRKQRRAVKHAAGIGKGRPTPKQPPRNMTRERHTAMLSRRAQRQLATGDARNAVTRMLDGVRRGKREDQEALERLLVDIGAVDLGRK